MKLVRNIDELMQSLYFISHMVQMKRAYARAVASAYANFISHMVQMKRGEVVHKDIIPQYFISHMVQMKHAGFWSADVPT